MNRTSYFLIASILTFSCVFSHELQAQHSYRVLFLGNSYTAVNNLPQLVHDVALSAGDTLFFESNTPGGYTLKDHSQNTVSRNKIMAGRWDYVVLQGQSQEPVIQPNQFINGGMDLYNLIKQYNPCAVPMPYMTWGRKNGDASNCVNFPVMCTYEGMDSALRIQYLKLTELMNGEVSPVSVVWKNIRQNYPSIELYLPDESHPSLQGSYAAACCFYTMLFKKDPTLITYHSGLSDAEASIIKNSAKAMVFDSLSSWDFKKPPIADISFQTGSGMNEVLFQAIDHGVQQNYVWDFGDGAIDSVSNPAHSYMSNGTYTVTLTTSTCDLQGLHTSATDTIIQFCNHTPTVFTSHPGLCYYDTLWTQPADACQWLANGVLLPETGQYLADYSRYSDSGFSVIATVNGCAELSQTFTDTPQGSGYYFEAVGDPCYGDTVAFAVLHINGYLSGSENIFWFQNDLLLPSMTHEDTLLITTSGKFECKVVNPYSDCPLDTTAYTVEFNCFNVGIAEGIREISWSIFPIPASETVIIKFTRYDRNGTIQMYNSTGQLIHEVVASETTSISMADLPKGLYFIRLKNGTLPPLRFMKR